MMRSVFAMSCGFLVGAVLPMVGVSFNTPQWWLIIVPANLAIVALASVLWGRQS